MQPSVSLAASPRERVGVGCNERNTARPFPALPAAALTSNANPCFVVPRRVRMAHYRRHVTKALRTARRPLRARQQCGYSHRLRHRASQAPSIERVCSTAPSRWLAKFRRATPYLTSGHFSGRWPDFASNGVLRCRIIRSSQTGEARMPRAASVRIKTFRNSIWRCAKHVGACSIAALCQKKNQGALH